MLTDEQVAILPAKAQEYVNDLREGLTSFSAVDNLCNWLATALVARQRDRLRLRRLLKWARVLRWSRDIWRERCEAARLHGDELVALSKERDELQRQLDAVLEDQVSVCEKCDAGKRLAEARERVDWLVKALTERSMQILPDEIERSVQSLAAVLAGGEGE